MKSFSRKFLRSQSGVSAIEFAIILPVMVTMFLGMAEVSNYIEMSRRASSLASTAADLVAQEAIVDNADINDVFATMAIVGSPMNPASIRISITSVVADPDGTTNRVAWSDAKNKTARTGALIIRLPQRHAPALSGCDHGRGRIPVHTHLHGHSQQHHAHQHVLPEAAALSGCRTHDLK